MDAPSKHMVDATAHTLITGIKGFTGSYVAETLANAGYRVTGTCMNTDQGIADNERILDIRSLDACCKLIDALRPSHIVHLAARSFVADADELGFYDSNVLGTLNLLKACEHVGHTPQRILIASSANVYGNASGVVDETYPPAPVNHYAASKLAMEHLARTWSDRLPIVLTRPFNYTGRGQESRFLVAKIVSHFQKRSTHIELGNLDVTRDFSDVRYVAACYRALLENPNAIGQTVNICSGHPYSLNQVIDFARSLSGHDLEVTVNPAFVRANEIKLLVGEPTRLNDLTGNIEAIPLRSTIGWMLRA